MKKLLTLLLILMPIVLMSCISSGEDITVNKDGSGQIVQTFMVKKDYVGFLNLSDQPSDPNLINIEELTAAANNMGEGVIFEKVEPMPEDSPYAGYKAYYSFEDITKIKANATPSTSPEASDENDNESIRFDFTPGKTSTLIIQMPEDNSDTDDTSDDTISEKSEGSEDSNSAVNDDDGMTEQLKEIYRDMHYWIRVSVAGNITDTNARHVDGSSIVILDMTFDKIVDNDELFTKITQQNTDKGMEEFAEELSEVGVLVEDKDTISVKFR